MITRQYLEQRIAELRLTIALHNGAIQFAELLLEELAKEERPGGNGAISAQDFAEMVAGPGAKVEGITNASENPA